MARQVPLASIQEEQQDVANPADCSTPGARGRVRERSYIIWFVGSAVWWIDAALVLHRGSRSRALTSLVIAVLFFAAGIFFQRFAPKR